MIEVSSLISEIQDALCHEEIGGWLFYDFRRSNPLALRVLQIPSSQLLTRRFFYWVPAKGEAIKIVHGIESGVLDHLPGEKRVFSTWSELESALQNALQDISSVAMEYSPRNAIPVVSKVDGGTIDLVRGLGVEVVSSANLLQKYTSILSPSQLESHFAAAEILSSIAELTWTFIANCLQRGSELNEYIVQQFMLEQFVANGCTTSDPPICAVNANSAQPHYYPTKERFSAINPGDFILIDLWCKQFSEDAIYADITRVAVAAVEPTAKQIEVFDVVRKAQRKATEWLEDRVSKGVEVCGWEVDQVCRDVIADHGYAKYFTHRTGHNIGTSDHGEGANIDNFESHDVRKLLKGTCFSIEPGIYLPEEFGVRLEYDVVLLTEGGIRITGGTQDSVLCLF